jgi:hypothetical protein
MTDMLKMIAKRLDKTTADFRHPSWDIFISGQTYATFRVSLCPGPFVWEFEALPGRYGTPQDNVDLARMMQERVHRRDDLPAVLRLVRALVEWQYEQHRLEAEAERETERRSEAFWENRMSDEDKAREDWEYSMYGA